MEGAVFALLGLLIAFTFSGAAARFDARRELVVEEANAIGTAYLRLDLLPADAQAALRDLFRRYLDTRLEAYAALPDLDRARAALARANALQAQIWPEALSASGRSPYPSAAVLLVPALNQMFDIATTRTATTFMHPPPVIFLMLAGIALLSAFLAGHGMAVAGRQAHWLHPLAYAFLLAVTFYVIVDLEYPRLGVIRVDTADQVLRDVRATMN
jgi:hypothetical protein